jgi:hypothetical protein
MGCWEFKPRSKMTEEEFEQFMERAKSVGLYPTGVRKATTNKETFEVVDYIALMK